MMNVAHRQMERLALRQAFQRLRAARKLAAFEVADALGVHVTHYSHVENGRRALTPDQRAQLAKLLRCKVTDIPEMSRRVA